MEQRNPEGNSWNWFYVGIGLGLTLFIYSGVIICFTGKTELAKLTEIEVLHHYLQNIGGMIFGWGLVKGFGWAAKNWK